MKQSFFLHQISITGLSAVGTSSAVQELKKLLPDNLYRFVSAGAVMRRYADGNAMTIEAFVRYCHDNPHLNIDREMDTFLNQLGATDYGVLESRLGHVLWRQAYQVRLVCDKHVCAARRAKQVGIAEDAALRLISERDQNDLARYEALYGPGVLWSDEKFHLVLDTERLTAAEVAEAIVTNHKDWKEDIVHRGQVETSLLSLNALRHFYPIGS